MQLSAAYNRNYDAYHLFLYSAENNVSFGKHSKIKGKRTLLSSFLFYFMEVLI